MLDLVEAACRGAARRAARRRPAVTRGGRAARSAVACAAARRVPGGDINDAWRVELDDGRARSSRRAPDAAPGEFAAEAAGLRWLAEADARAGARGARRSPTAFLALEWIERGAGRRGGRGGARPRARAAARAPARRRSGRRRRGAPRRAAARRARAAGGDRRRGPRSTPSGGSRPLAAHGPRPRRAARGRRARSSASARGCRSSPARRSRPPACTATSGAATCWPTPRPAVADRPGRLRRPPRGRPGDAPALRRARRRARSPPTRRSTRSPTGTRERVALWQLFPLLVHAVLFGGGYGARRGARAGLRHDGAHGPGHRERTAVVTGGTRGIGAAVAELLEREGTRVVRVARSEGIDVTARRCGRADRRPRRRASRHPRQQRRHVGDQAARRDERRRLLRDVRAQRDGADAADAPLRAADGGARLGRIVNVTSSAGKRPSQAWPAYSVAKAAQHSLSRLYADFWAPRGVHINAVAPGPTGTPLWRAPGGLAEQKAAREGISAARRRSSASRARCRSAASASRPRSPRSSSSSAPSARRG